MWQRKKKKRRNDRRWFVFIILFGRDKHLYKLFMGVDG